MCIFCKYTNIKWTWKSLIEVRIGRDDKTCSIYVETGSPEILLNKPIPGKVKIARKRKMTNDRKNPTEDEREEQSDDTMIIPQTEKCSTEVDNMFWSNEVSNRRWRAIVSSKDKEITELNDKITELQKQLESKNAETESLKEDNQNLRNDLDSWSEDLQACDERVTDLNLELKTLRKEKEKLETPGKKMSVAKKILKEVCRAVEVATGKKIPKDKIINLTD